MYSSPNMKPWKEGCDLLAWIESHQELWRHPKLKKLSRRLGISKQEAVGYLHLLWWWALDYAQNGQVIPPHENEDISDAVEWQGDPDVFINAMIDAGFLERSTDNALVIHDWYDYAGKLIERREKDRKRKEEDRKGKS